MSLNSNKKFISKFNWQMWNIKSKLQLSKLKDKSTYTENSTIVNQEVSLISELMIAAFISVNCFVMKMQSGWCRMYCINMWQTLRQPLLDSYQKLVLYVSFSYLLTYLLTYLNRESNYTVSAKTSTFCFWNNSVKISQLFNIRSLLNFPVHISTNQMITYTRQQQPRNMMSAPDVSELPWKSLKNKFLDSSGQCSHSVLVKLATL